MAGDDAYQGSTKEKSDVGQRPYRPTILPPPPPDPNKAAIENVLEVTELAVLGPDIFTNARPTWHPPGARGIFGGSVIALSFAAAQKTIPDPTFALHSAHCYFLLGGDGGTPIIFHVERVRDGKSYIARTVQARQRGAVIFTVTLSFTRRAAKGEVQEVEHGAVMPEHEDPPDVGPDEDIPDSPPWFTGGPFQNDRIRIVGRGKPPSEQSTQQWVRAKGRISDEGGSRAHVNALAYLSDSFFIGTVARVNRLWRFGTPPKDIPSLPEKERKRIASWIEWDGGGEPRDGKGGEEVDVEAWQGSSTLGMMVSLDHSIYVHEPEKIRADEWMLCVMQSPWSGGGRGLVRQHIFARDGTLLATCFQEGVTRIKRPEMAKSRDSKL